MPKGLKGFQKGHRQFNSGRTQFKDGQTWEDMYGEDGAKRKRIKQGMQTRERNLVNNPMKNPETVEKARKKNIGRKFSRSAESKRTSSNARIKLLEKGFKNPIQKGQSYKEVFGEKKAMEIKNKQSLASKGKKKSEEHIKKIIKNRKHQILPIKDSSIEVKIQTFLTQLKIEFFTHQYMKIEHGYQCDILVPSMNLVIECDGDYWHGNPEIFAGDKLTEKMAKQRERDEARTNELVEKGFNVLRLWEHEIKVMDVKMFEIAINGVNNG